MIRVVILNFGQIDMKQVAAVVEKAEGYELLGCCDVENRTLEKLNNIGFDLLIFAGMPAVSGMKLLQAIRNSGKQIDVIVMSKYLETDSLKKMLQLGIADCIVKPFTYLRLKRALHVYSEKRRIIENDEAEIVQEVIDRYILGQNHVYFARKKTLPKGILSSTLSRIYTCFEGEKGSIDVNFIVEKSGLSQPVARKYLKYLLETNKIMIEVRPVAVGRPKRSYRLKCVV